MDRLCNRVEPFAALFGALGSVHTSQHLTLPADEASLHRRTQRMSLYSMVIFSSILNEDEPPPPLLSRYVSSQAEKSEDVVCTYAIQ